MADFNSKISRILREFDDEYADLDDEDEFEEGVMHHVGTKQFGDIEASLYTDGSEDELFLTVAGDRFNWSDPRFPEAIGRCWELAGYSEEARDAEIAAWIEKTGIDRRMVNQSPRDKMWQKADDIIQLLRQEFTDPFG